jgi:Ni/Fe-hydrogenase subunit HybB-like protein
MNVHKPIGGKLITPTTAVLAVLVLIGFFFIGVRFVHGIGAVTNINPGYSWGIWVVIDIVVGTAFGCGGFAMAILVYIFNRGAYHPLMRPALLAGLFGYGLAGMAVMIDLGRYWQFYNLLLPWYAQPNAVMYEVAMCVMAYVFVLFIEFSPAFLERFGLHRIRRHLLRVMFVFAALGVLLPTMHQSSLGSLLLLLGEHQLSPLWYTMWLPLLFLSTAIAMGYGAVMFEATVVSKTFHLHSEQPILAKLSKVVAGLLAAIVIFRVVDLALTGSLGLAFAGDLKGTMFLIENALFLFAIFVLATPGGRASQRLMFLAAVANLLGGALYRIDSYLIAYTPTQNWAYFPSVPELMITIGMISLEILLYLIFIKLLPVLSGAHTAHAAEAR